MDNSSMNSVRANATDSTSRMTASQQPLNIVIAGAGIGGLSAAIFLRRQGHRVTLLEQSRFATETGAAVFLCPNSTGLLQRMGIFAQDSGANPIMRMTQYSTGGKEVWSSDLEEANRKWQNPWLLAHRVRIHSELKKTALASDGPGQPVTLRLSSRVTDVEVDGRVTLASGEQISADLVVGADGVHSKTRAKMPGAEGIMPFGSGKNAFRFMVERKVVLDDPMTRKFAERDGEFVLIHGADKKIVMYPTSDNTIVNVACFYPSSESEVRADTDNNWNQQANKSRLLDIFKSFALDILQFLAKADESTLKVWEILDMATLDTWTDGKLALIGDAAHPFMPHQGQGASQAIEDAASLAVVLPAGTTAAEVPERLKLYEKCRYERATLIQDYSRISGRDVQDGQKLDITDYSNYNCGHDEWDHSSQAFREWLWKRNPHLKWRTPVPFGPIPGPRQRFDGTYYDPVDSTFKMAYITVKTSRTLLQNLFPSSAFSFVSPATIATVTFSATTFDNLEWLAGGSYSNFGLYIHGVQCLQKDSKKTSGTFLPILFEDLADQTLSRAEELGLPKVYSVLNVDSKDDQYKLQAGWQKSTFCDLSLEDLEEVDVATYNNAFQNTTDHSLMSYKHTPKTADSDNGSEEPGGAGVEYTTVLPNTEEAKVDRKVTRAQSAKKSSVKFNALNWRALPTLHHIVSRLEELPIYEVVEARIVEGTGVSDVSSMVRFD